jgi:hypothetical protein
VAWCECVTPVHGQAQKEGILAENLHIQRVGLFVGSQDGAVVAIGEVDIEGLLLNDCTIFFGVVHREVQGVIAFERDVIAVHEPSLM